MKFRECLPVELLLRMLRARWVDEKALRAVTEQPRRVVMIRDDDEEMLPG